MDDWTFGYMADIDYTYGYYGEFNALRLRLAFLHVGLVPPTVMTACDLGFGQGLSTNIHAASSPIQWYGTDFNPSQAGLAQEMASFSGANPQLVDQSFAEFCQRQDLPDFDFIGLHGIWSWISDANRAAIVDFIRRKLKVGGVVYISYNTLPSWAPIVPLRNLLTEHSQIMGAPGVGVVSRIDTALDFADKLMAVNPAYTRLNPSVAKHFEKMKGQSRNYLAHEYFNQDWLPMQFSSMAKWLTSAKLSYACSAHYLDHIEALNLEKDQLSLINEIPDTAFRETVRDFLVNRQFRRDYWVKGARKLDSLAQIDTLRKQRVLLAKYRADVSLTVNGAQGEGKLHEPVYVPVLDVLADHKPRTLGEIEQAVASKGVNFAKLLQVIMVLAGTGALYAVQDQEVIARSKPYTDKLNAYICNQARGNAVINFLASPVIGGGVAVPRFHQLFLLARSDGKTHPSQWAAFAWAILDMQGQALHRNGKTLEGPEENLAELTAQANEFAEKHIPVLQAIQIA